MVVHRDGTRDEQCCRRARVGSMSAARSPMWTQQGAGARGDCAAGTQSHAVQHTMCCGSTVYCTCALRRHACRCALAHRPPSSGPAKPEGNDAALRTGHALSLPCKRRGCMGTNAVAVWGAVCAHACVRRMAAMPGGSPALGLACRLRLMACCCRSSQPRHTQQLATAARHTQSGTGTGTWQAPIHCLLDTDCLLLLLRTVVVL